MAWTSLSFAYGSVLTSTKMTQMYDNFAYGAGSTAPTFITGTAGVTQSVGNNTTLLATTAFVQAAEFVNNDVGVSGVGAFGRFGKLTAGTVVSGATIAGSDLVAMLVDGNFGTVSFSGNPTGTWRNISPNTVGVYNAANTGGTFQRIS